VTEQPDEFGIFRQDAESKARRHHRLLVALGVATEPESKASQGDAGEERERPDEPAA
jgi:hypothetical protein